MFHRISIPPLFSVSFTLQHIRFFCYNMGCNGQVLLLLDDTSLWAIFAGGESELMDLSPAHIKIDKSPTGRGRALLQRQCFYDQKKYICNRPLAPNNLHGKMHKHKTTRGWRGERLGHSQTINV